MALHYANEQASCEYFRSMPPLIRRERREVLAHVPLLSSCSPWVRVGPGIAPWRTFLGGTADMTFSPRGWTLKEPYAGSAIRRRPAAGRGCSCARVATVTKTPAPTKAPIAMCLKVIALRSLGIHQPTDLALRVRMDLPSFVGNTETMRNSCHRGSTGPAYDG